MRLVSELVLYLRDLTGLAEKSAKHQASREDVTHVDSNDETDENGV